MKWVFSWVPLAIVLMAGADVPAGLHAQEAPMGSFTLAAPSLSTLVDAALARDPAQELTPVLEREAEALARRSRSWISGAPVIAAHWQDDALSSDAGLREGEVGLDLPLWWPNARRAARLLTEASADEAKLRPRYNRWQAAGVIRERLWALAMAQVNLAQAQDAERSSISLHEQVLARVQAGDLAQTDQLMSEQEMLARQAERQLAEREWAAQRASLRFLLGLEPDVGALQPEPQSRVPLEDHPGLALLAQETRRAQAQWTQLVAQGAGAPVIQIGSRRERSNREEDEVNSLGIGISVPFAGAVHLGPERLAAERALAEARVRWQQAVREQTVARQESEASLRSAQETLELAQRRGELARRQQDLAQTAFGAGELDLMDLLRIREQSRLTIREAERQRIKVGRETARLNQIMGVVP
jgi:outer membrane protein TolC